MFAPIPADADPCHENREAELVTLGVTFRSAEAVFSPADLSGRRVAIPDYPMIAQAYDLPMYMESNAKLSQK